MRVCLGGTFDPFHVGHERLLDRALELAGSDGEVFVGLVDDAYSAKKRDRTVAPYPDREARVRTYLQAQGANDRVRIRPLVDAHGPSATGDYDAIVASVETAATAHGVNDVRRANGLTPLQVHLVPYVLGQDLLPVSATRIALGDVDRDGTRKTAVRIVVGSANPVKVAAARSACARMMPEVHLEVRGRAVDTTVAEQPHGDDTRRGAEARARAALAADIGAPADYGIGIEAGLFDLGGRLFDIQYCVIRDRTGLETVGIGPGFTHPEAVAQALAGGQTVGAVYARLAHDPEVGRASGAVGWLTRGRFDRTRLTESAVEAALVPRVRREVYDLGIPDTTPAGSPDPHG